LEVNRRWARARYRRNKHGGAWLARRYDGATSRYRESAIGAADDVHDADGVAVLSFHQAQTAARAWWTEQERRALGAEPVEGHYTVADALRDYFGARERRGSRGVYSDRRYAEARIMPVLGRVELEKLTTAKLRRWHEHLAAEPKLLRTAKAATRRTQVVDPKDVEGTRARRATAKRILTVLLHLRSRAWS
jgi:hypothetical protein